jgi:hypothetical protein
MDITVSSFDPNRFNTDINYQRAIIQNINSGWIFLKTNTPFEVLQIIQDNRGGLTVIISVDNINKTLHIAGPGAYIVEG